MNSYLQIILKVKAKCRKIMTNPKLFLYNWKTDDYDYVINDRS